MPDKPLPRPWTMRSNDDAFWIECANGVRFAYTYHRKELMTGTGETRTSKAVARQITLQIMRLPDLLEKSK